jgi:hypothetical protein
LPHCNKKGLAEAKRHRGLIVCSAPDIRAIKADGRQLEIALIVGIKPDLRIPGRQPAPDLPVGDLLIQQSLLDLRIML